MMGSFCVNRTEAAADGAGETLGTINRLATTSQSQRLAEQLRKPGSKESIIPDYEPEKDEEGRPYPEPSFVLKEIEFKGNTVFPSPEFKEFYAPYIGQKVRLENLKKVAIAITKKYRKAGYFLSYAAIPTQTITDGKVKIQVFEGYIDKADIVFEEKTTSPSSRLVGMVQKIRKDRPLHQDTYERYLLLMQELYPNAKGYLEPSGKNKDGAASLRIIIPKSQPVEGSIGGHNYANDTVGPLMSSVGVSVAPFWNPEHRLKANYSQGNSASELWTANVGYTLPLFSEGTSFSVNQLISRSQPRGKVKNFNIKMRDYRSTFTLMHPFVRSRDTNFYGGVELAIQNQRRIHGIINDLFKERSRNLKAFVMVNWKDRLKGANFMRLAGIQGLRILREKQETDPNLTREKGAADRFYFEGEISRMQHIAGPYAIGFYLMGQYAGNALLGIDRYRSNGFPFNGAYPVGALAGDSGLEGKVELNYYNYDIQYFKLLRLFAYLSQVKIWNRNPTNIEQWSESAKGAGCGTQVVMENGLSATLEYGYPFNSPVGGDSITPRVGFNLNWKF